ncbi:MAG: phosphoribosylformylglycinamidine synthase subunit PurL [Bacteroidetes bacterium]|nr:phosphoribosylformylglycinamidine synthase subunit PurL [Bacteroidota bacterium]MBU1718882.1 phosphoribosylformylglycinamidine synthase subunit PurL [Bacteroidota bacterium]
MKEVEANYETAGKLGLLPEEFDKICEFLDRVPNFMEMSLYSVMWSEHCSYKNSIKWLKTLPKKGPHMLAEAGEENAGLVDIGDGLACAFKIESHNHPSAVEPYQGAATGVGGINRDIFTMGARPVAQLNSLRFGKIDNERTRWLLKGVVKGIGDYGNSFGVPVLGGEVYFEECYQMNPLVNAMSVGIVNVGETVSATSYGKGNPVYIVGSSTGKDGIHGATFASEDITEESGEKLPSVQVGDPFQEKLLLEATLEVIKTGAVVGMQDMGAAGIVCSTSEMSAKGEHGMNIWLDKVPLRQQNMKPWEICLSESQERMLIVVKKGMEAIVEQVFDKWDLNCAIIGEVIEGDILNYFWHNEIVASVPADSLVLGGGAPVYEREYRQPAYYAETKEFDMRSVPEPVDLQSVMDHLLTHPNIASKRWVFEQYDTMVQTNNMSTNFPTAAAIINLKGSEKALVVSVDCNGRHVYSDPEIGTMIAVAEAARNISCTGAEPGAVTNCLNFGNPYNPEVYWQFVGAIKGMSAACLQFQTPVTGGNVSFYNQSTVGNKTEPVYPTPTIGMIGLLESKKFATSLAFPTEETVLYLLGKNPIDICNSQYVSSFHNVRLSPPPYFNLEEEYQMQVALRALIRKGLICAANDISDGGLYITLCESGFKNKKGFEILIPDGFRHDAFLFGEAQGRVVVAVKPENEQDLVEYSYENQLPCQKLGKTTSGRIFINVQEYSDIAVASDLYLNALERKLSN